MAKITATSKSNPKAKAMCRVKVYKATKKIKLVSNEKYTLKEKESVTLKAKVTGSAKGAAPIRWESSNSNTVKVSSKGKVTAVSPGTVVVTASSGKKSVKVTITVKEQSTEEKPKEPTEEKPEEPAEGTETDIV